MKYLLPILIFLILTVSTHANQTQKSPDVSGLLLFVIHYREVELLLTRIAIWVWRTSESR